MTNKLKTLSVAVAALGIATAGAAHADYAFSGSGTSGTLVGADETWSFNFDHQFGATQPDWGSPGVDASVTAYDETEDAFGMQISFSAGTVIDAASVAIGNNAACAGSTGGGTTFCTIGVPEDIWVATIVNPTTINFIAQDPSVFLHQGQDYFVNIFFTSDTPTSFTGKWITDFTGGSGPGVPEPASWALMISGFGLAGAALRRRRSFAAA
jgi:hypothetical protein